MKSKIWYETSLVYIARVGESDVLNQARCFTGLTEDVGRKRQYIQKALVASISAVWRQLDKLMITTKFGRK